jgi:hypothetical protein
MAEPAAPIAAMDSRVTTGPATLPQDESPAERRDRAAAADAELDVRLKGRVADVALTFMGAQVVAADGVFVAYGIANGWHAPPSAIVGWLSATVVEVIGVVVVISRYLFPRRDLRGARQDQPGSTE